MLEGRLEPFGEVEQKRIVMPTADELQADGQSLLCPAAGQRQRGVPGHVERERIRVPGAADRPPVLSGDRDPRQWMEPDR